MLKKAQAQEGNAGRWGKATLRKGKGKGDSGSAKLSGFILKPIRRRLTVEPARTFFWNVGHVRILIYILAIIPVVFIVYGLYKRYLLWKQGVPENRTQNLSDRISSLIQNGLFQ
jgi:hypothetical protein